MSIRVKYDGDQIDDLFAKDADVHIERLDVGRYWVRVSTVDGEISFDLYAKARRGHVASATFNISGAVEVKK